MGNSCSDKRKSSKGIILIEEHKMSDRSEKETSSNKHTMDFVSNTETLNEEESTKVATNCWDTVLKLFDSDNSLTKDDNSADYCNTVRIFVSSTFTDFFHEREALVKKVFPELRDWCNEFHGVGVQEVDLRWGVPQDSTSTDTISLCMQELQTCSKTAAGKPFFIALIGSRYGWIPSKDEIPSELVDQWIPNLSITNMEIVQGAMKHYNPNACFFFRDPEFLKQIPGNVKSRFLDENRFAKAMLKKLSSNVRSLYPESVFGYKVDLEGMDKDTSQPVIGGLDDFSKNVFDFLKKAIESALESRNGTSSNQFIPTEPTFAGRETEIKQVLDYCRQPINNECQFLVVQSPKGLGKTALLAQAVRLLKKETSSRLFYHFCSSTLQSSSQLNNLLRSLAEYMDSKGQSVNLDTTTELKYFDETTMQFVKEKLEKFEGIFIFDGIDQLDHASSPLHLSWLPDRISPSTKIVLSFTEQHLPTLSRVQERAHTILNLNSLPIEDQKSFCEQYLLEYGKRLTESQTVILLGKGRDLVWLKLALEELRIIGHYKKVDAILNTLPPDYVELASVILDRIINEDQELRLKKVLQILCCDSDLQEDDIQWLIGEQEEKIPAILWARILRSLRPFVRFSGGNVFIQDTVLRQIISEKFLPNEPEKQEIHGKIANYFDKSSNLRRSMPKLAYHLHKAKRKQKLVSFLLTDKRVNFMIPHERQKWIQDLKCGKMVLNVGETTPACTVCVWCPTVPNSCTLCSSIGAQSQAYYCNLHSTPPKKCIKCNRPLPNPKIEAKIAYICSKCKGYTRTCAYLHD